ncbi:MAG: hypothetical protein ACI9H6_000360 [Patiriisocius sp.]|jgi:hypothetical protein
MGGESRVSSYADAQEAVASTRSSAGAFDYSHQATQSGAGKTHTNLNIKGVVRECRDSDAMPNITPIIVGMDVTRSRGPDAKAVYERVEQMLGSTFLSGAAPDPQIMFAAIGDATSDRAPLQVGQFESDERMDDDLSRVWMEEGGGGSGEESYELFAYYAARKTAVDAIDERGQKGFCFITGDEAPYPQVSKKEVKRIIGDTIDADIPTADIFAELQARYNTYFIFPAASMEARKDDIDAEIRQRLLKAGGRFENCSIRASLIWNDYNDLDLHVVTPDGEEIMYSHKDSKCGGNLDVDANGGGGRTKKPVENIRWAKGTAKAGKYQVFVRNYTYHERDHSDIPFKVELDIDGVIQTFEGKTEAGQTGPGSDVTVFEFEYTAEQSVNTNADDRESYTDEVILAKWRSYIPEAHIIRVADASHATEAMVGIMAIQNGVMSLEEFVANMHERAVAMDCAEDVEKALEHFAAQGVFSQVSEAAFA